MAPQRLSIVTDFYALPPPWKGPVFPINWETSATSTTVEPVVADVHDLVSPLAKRTDFKKAKRGKALAKARYLKSQKKYAKRSAKRYVARHRRAYLHGVH
jgi:hypothetical protein